LLLSIANEEKPLIVFDPFRNSHACDENSSTEMAGVMEQLAYMKSRGATVIIVHHVGKAEGSTSRGSSAIDGAVDLALVQTMDADSGIIELRTIKNRFGEAYHFSIRPDFDQYTFSITNSPQFAKRTAELEKLGEIIRKEPGLSQNAIVEASGMMRARVIDLLRKNTGTLWTVEPGPKRAKTYYPPDRFSKDRTSDRTIELVAKNAVSGSSGSPLKGREPQNHFTSEHSSSGSKPNGHTLPCCPKCKGFALYHGVCQTCEAGGAAC